MIPAPEPGPEHRVPEVSVEFVVFPAAAHGLLHWVGGGLGRWVSGWMVGGWVVDFGWSDRWAELPESSCLIWEAVFQTWFRLFQRSPIFLPLVEEGLPLAHTLSSGNSERGAGEDSVC